MASTALGSSPDIAFHLPVHIFAIGKRCLGSAAAGGALK
jgi:hypothetical protein